MRKSIQNIGFFVFKVLVVAFMMIGIYTFTKKSDSSDISLKQLKEVLLPLMEQQFMEAGNHAKFRQLYGLNANDYEEVLLYIPVSNMDVEELLIVKVKDSSQIKAIQSAIGERIAEQKTRFDGYGTNQMGLLEKAQQSVLGDYVLLVVSEQSSVVKEEFSKNLRP